MAESPLSGSEEMLQQQQQQSQQPQQRSHGSSPSSRATALDSRGLARSCCSRCACIAASASSSLPGGERHSVVYGHQQPL